MVYSDTQFKFGKFYRIINNFLSEKDGIWILNVSSIRILETTRFIFIHRCSHSTISRPIFLQKKIRSDTYDLPRIPIFDDSPRNCGRWAWNFCGAIRTFFCLRLKLTSSNSQNRTRAIFFFFFYKNIWHVRAIEIFLVSYKLAAFDCFHFEVE